MSEKKFYGIWKKEKLAVDLLCSVNTKVNLYVNR